MTFDSEAELMKVACCHDNAKSRLLSIMPWTSISLLTLVLRSSLSQDTFRHLLLSHWLLTSLPRRSSWIQPLMKPKPDEIMYPCSIWGPTCDGLDRIVEQCNLPDMQVGDWLVFENMGAYTVVTSSTFNGFQRPGIHYVMSRPAWQHMQQICLQGMPAPAEEFHLFEVST
ncbi:ornithine decarboxylase-like [Hippoglossus stenolepis]|uniref:ornithine decarboxylase-like n=1 Tax=Hippoglossus stenolepis TaxID=195615 RepID=UPI001FAF7E1B|nr:ornithine decarboxylase-like [Hippoglossus stenolepis]